jgi:hypothetical protein
LEIIPKNTKVNDALVKEIIEKHSFKPTILEKSAKMAKKRETQIITELLNTKNKDGSENERAMSPNLESLTLQEKQKMKTHYHLKQKEMHRTEKIS